MVFIFMSFKYTIYTYFNTELTEALLKKITLTDFWFQQSKDSPSILNSFAVTLIDVSVMHNLEKAVAWQLMSLLQVPFVIRDYWSVCCTSFRTRDRALVKAFPTNDFSSYSLLFGFFGNLASPAPC